MPRRPRALLDLGGGHGWYSASLCRRYPGLTATVLDLPGSAAVGRELIAEADLSDRVLFRDGDVTTADLGGGYDAVLCFNLIHHLAPAQAAGLLRRIRAALNPGGTLAILDVFAEPGRRAGAHADLLALFVYLQLGCPGAHARRARRLAARCGFRLAAGDTHASRPRPDAAGRQLIDRDTERVPGSRGTRRRARDPAGPLGTGPGHCSHARAGAVGAASHRPRCRLSPADAPSARDEPGLMPVAARLWRGGRRVPRLRAGHLPGVAAPRLAWPAAGLPAVPRPARRRSLARRPAARESGVIGGWLSCGGSGPMTALSTCEFGTDSMPVTVASLAGR